MSLISLVDVCKSYQMGTVKNVVLKSISLDISGGDMLAIVGASGSGKSTLMNILGLLDKPDEGTYYLNHQNVAHLSSDELASRRNQYIGFVFQQFHLLPRFTAEENVSLPLIYRQESPSVAREKARLALTRVGMGDLTHHRPTQLSGGQQQRVAIARALVGEPEIILADEPTGALDSGTGKDVMALFSNLHQEGRTVILITHDEQVAAHCKRRITLADGQIVNEVRG